MSQVAQTLAWLARPYDFLRRCAEEVGDSFTLDLGSHGLYAIVSHPEDVRAVFTASPEIAHAGEGNGILGALLGPRSLLLLEEDAHLRERKLLLPPFHGKSVDSIVGAIAEIAEDAARVLGPGREVVLQEVMARVSLSAIRRAVFGSVRVDTELDDALRAFLDDPKFNLALIGHLRDQGAFDPIAWRRFQTVLERIDTAVLSAIHAARRDGCDGMLGMLVAARDEHGKPLEDAHLRDQIVTLVVTGYETTATALAWAFYWIHADPEVLATARAEARAAGPVRDARSLGQLRYLDSVCRESLRIRPVLPIVARKLHAPLALRDRTLPAGITVAPCSYLAHHRTEAFVEPDRFFPGRFLEREPTPYEYFPFGGGARRCLGMTLALTEMRVVLATFLARCDLRPVDMENVKAVRRSVTVAPRGGVRMEVLAAREAR
jgi:cytochrome P450 family 110